MSGIVGRVDVCTCLSVFEHDDVLPSQVTADSMAARILISQRFQLTFIPAYIVSLCTSWLLFIAKHYLYT